MVVPLQYAEELYSKLVCSILIGHKQCFRYLNSIDAFLSQLLNQLDSAERAIRTEMTPHFFDNTIDEFLFITVGQTTDKLRTWLNECRRLKKLRTYPARHFSIERVKEL